MLSQGPGSSWGAGVTWASAVLRGAEGEDGSAGGWVRGSVVCEARGGRGECQGSLLPRGVRRGPLRGERIRGHLTPCGSGRGLLAGGSCCYQYECVCVGGTHKGRVTTMAFYFGGFLALIFIIFFDSSSGVKPIDNQLHISSAF